MGKARGAAPRGRAGWPGARARARRGPGGLGRRPSATCRRDPARPRGERAAGTRRAGWRGAGVAAAAGWGLARDRGPSAPSAQSAGRRLGRAPRAGAGPRGGAGGRAAPGRPQPPATRARPRPRRCAARAALRGLPQTWAPPPPTPPPTDRSPGRSFPSAGQPRAAPPGPRLRLGGRHLPPEAPGGRGRRALGGSRWSARGAEERAPLRLFPETPPGGVRPAGPGRLLTPAATLLPARPGHGPGRALPLRALRRPLLPRAARSTGGQDGDSWGPPDAPEGATHPTHSGLGWPGGRRKLFLDRVLGPRGGGGRGGEGWKVLSKDVRLRPPLSSPRDAP